MALKMNSADSRTRSSVSIFIVVGLCCFFYILGAWQKSGFGKGDSIAVEITKQTDCGILTNLNFETHHNGASDVVDVPESKVEVIQPCNARYTDYTPCQDQKRAMTFPRENMNYRERHCPPEDEKLRCLIPAPKGYVTPFPWPKSRDYVFYANVPYKSLTVEKAVQNWVQYEGNVFRFPGGGTQFPQGADAYIKQLASVIPIANGTVRTALDTGCGVASWGAYLLKRNVLAMSFAPRDSHEAQVQFALERGVPAVIGVLGTIQLPYPSRAFDMAHCSRCLIPWGANDGMYMMEVDRVLRPGGYWVLSGPPINWKNNYKAWQRPKEELQEEQRKIEEVAKLLCWEKKSEKGEIAIWRKRINTASCPGRQDARVTICESTNADDVWCEGFSTYPRTYDLIHANGLFSLYQNKCKLEDILLEMDRILRPEGAVILRDEVDVLIKVKRIVDGMRWNTKMVDHEDGPLVPEKILVAVKQYWTVGNGTYSE
ncbi:probable methyltransferase PMT2 isoform X2 [Magnolia sinica]|uniref:probable methyltransferase PMT2 isoform X2 n=1 Tax=Magnolia sinica TaxID=86752 RepID=UPI002659BA47|nr:probable methyltransferase PMT2 isoform X2 [Magnolia sinica]